MCSTNKDDANILSTMKIDRSAISCGNIHEESDEKAYWLSRTPEERLEALELYRQIAYGYDLNTLRLQRVLEIAEFPTNKKD